MAITVHSDVHAIVLVKALRIPASPETFVLALSPRKELVLDEEIAFAFPDLGDRKDEVPQVSASKHLYKEKQLGSQLPPYLGDGRLGVPSREEPTKLLIKSNLRLIIIRSAVISAWYCSNIALLLTNR